MTKGSLAPLGFGADASHLYDLQVAGLLALPGFFLCWWLVGDQSGQRQGSVNTRG